MFFFYMLLRRPILRPLWFIIFMFLVQTRSHTKYARSHRSVPRNSYDTVVAGHVSFCAPHSDARPVFLRASGGVSNVDTGIRYLFTTGIYGIPGYNGNYRITVYGKYHQPCYSFPATQWTINNRMTMWPPLNDGSQVGGRTWSRPPVKSTWSKIFATAWSF